MKVTYTVINSEQYCQVKLTVLDLNEYTER